MRLLICTQAVDRNDSILGFFHAWLERFARECESVTVICLRKGDYALPKNVEVISLGEQSRIQRAFEVCTIAWGRRNEYDAVFVHMNPEYIVAAGWLWRLRGKRIALWYVHKSKTLLLRVAIAFCNIIFTVSRDTFPLRNSKVRITGHGVDTDLFKPISAVDNLFRVVTIGRISAKKNTQKIIDAVLKFARTHDNVSLDVYGEPVTSEEKKYADELKTRLPSSDPKKIVTLKGAVAHDTVPTALLGASVFINMGETGGIDKAVLEAMSSAIPVISTSTAHAPLLKRYPQLVAEGEEGLVSSLEYIYTLSASTRKAIGEDLREDVVAHHGLDALIRTLCRELA